MSNSILSKPCSYAIRAMVHLAEQPPGQISSTRQICDEENIPSSFLGKVILPLCRGRMVRSLRGTGGGYELAVPPNEIRLSAIVEAIDGSQLKECILEDHPCGHSRECLLHGVWTAVREPFLNYLECTTVADLVRIRKSTQVRIPEVDDKPRALPST
jgi:Rrf2 family transcriptional regulator, iron-sulfur cluster assembly transcription factor